MSARFQFLEWNMPGSRDMTRQKFFLTANIHNDERLVCRRWLGRHHLSGIICTHLVVQTPLLDKRAIYGFPNSHLGKLHTQNGQGVGLLAGCVLKFALIVILPASALFDLLCQGVKTPPDQRNAPG